MQQIVPLPPTIWQQVGLLPDGTTGPIFVFFCFLETRKTCLCRFARCCEGHNSKTGVLYNYGLNNMQSVLQSKSPVGLPGPLFIRVPFFFRVVEPVNGRIITSRRRGGEATTNGDSCATIIFFFSHILRTQPNIGTTMEPHQRRHATSG